jgi:TRAP-type C4-dicarboxylate transport system substrate-binding protein
LGVFGLAAAALLATGSAGAVSIKDKEITMRIGSGHAPNITYVGEVNKFFVPRVVERVEKETGYKIKFNEHYSGTVVNVFDTLEGTQDGRLDIGAWCVCFDDDKAMAMNINYFVPFHHPDARVNIKIMRKLMAQYPELIQDLEGRYNQKLIAITGFNNYGLFTGFDWNKFEDLKGRKILAAGPNLPWVKGGIPVRTNIPQLAQMMQTGVGEGVVLFPDTDYKLKLHETVKQGFYTVTDFGGTIQIVVTMNLDTRKKLPPEVLKIIDEVALEYETHATEVSMGDHQWGLDKLAEAGVKIKKIDPQAKKEWAMQLKDWPNERAHAVKGKKNIDMPKIMNAFIKLSEEVGHAWPIQYPISE